jgi:hypothetical protein
VIRYKLNTFRRWAREARYNEVFVYHREPLVREEDVFDYARKLSDAGLAFLYQRKLDDGRWEKCARRSRVADHLVLDKVSKRVQVAASSAAETDEDRPVGRPKKRAA